MEEVVEELTKNILGLMEENVSNAGVHFPHQPQFLINDKVCHNSDSLTDLSETVTENRWFIIVIKLCLLVKLSQ